MAKIIFPNITLYPSSGSVGLSTSTKPRVAIPHIVGTGSNGIAVGKNAKPKVTGTDSITSAVGSLVDHNGINGKVYRLREALDSLGNVSPGSTPLPVTITDITVTNVYPPLTTTTVQFAPVNFSNSKFYKFEIEDELEYELYDTPNANVPGE